MPGIHGQIEVGVVAPHRALGKVKLSKDYGSGLFELRNHRSIVVGDKVRQRARPPHRPHTIGVAKILYGDRYSVEWTPESTGPNLLVGQSGRLTRLVCHHRGVALEPSVDAFNSREHQLGQLHGGQISRLDHSRDVLQTGIVNWPVEVGVSGR